MGLSFYPFLFIYFGIQKETALFLSLIYIGVWYGSEVLRINYGINTPTAFLVRNTSRHSFAGDLKKHWKRIRVPYWAFGLTIVLIFFNYQALLAATVVLVFGDTASALIRAGTKIYDKKLGYVTGVAVSALILFALTLSLPLSVLPSIIGMIGDVFSGKVNDNLTIPVLAGLATYFIF
jgi:dolichol kinase